MKWIVEIEESFYEAKLTWPLELLADITEIVRRLEADGPLFWTKPPEDYLFDHDSLHRVCVCQRLSGWGGWQLWWCYDIKEPITIDPSGSIRIKAKNVKFQTLRTGM